MSPSHSHSHHPSILLRKRPPSVNPDWFTEFIKVWSMLGDLPCPLVFPSQDKMLPGPKLMRGSSLVSDSFCPSWEAERKDPKAFLIVSV